MVTLEEIAEFLNAEQPNLTLARSDNGFRMFGTFVVYAKGIPSDQFEVQIFVTENFPEEEAKVFETAGRIPRTPARHMNGDNGECCITVWEAWLAETDDRSFAGFMNGPVSDYFLGQALVDRGEDWPFGELPHGMKGVIVAFAKVLGISKSEQGVVRYLTILSYPHIKGHFSCPCGSELPLRKCHGLDVEALSSKIDFKLARQMLRRLKAS
ncbi:MAG: hypothetical protein IPK75_04595 [Acidobacteria bacterium]|nr:hypothetical protein [Acidobacteriota bacterium]